MAAKKTWRIERKLEMGEESEIARHCWKKIKERTLGKSYRNGKNKEEIFIEKESKQKERKKGREDLDVTRVGYERKRGTKRKEIGKIKKSRYNVQYKEERMPQYLKNRWGNCRWQKIARFRLENKMREGRYYIY